MNYLAAAKKIVTALPVDCPCKFSAHGVTFDVRKIRRGEYSLGAEGVQRRRYGTYDQIRQDVAHCLEFGKLPERIDGAF